MSNYVITFFNKSNREWRSENISKMTFAEAVVFANKQRTKLGYEWEISAISKTIKDDYLV